ncbi:hypothetical protein MIND_01329000 [Mycena indigotica]|uniref:F-box domain-containing protein n=1 Tax=Mycena indigotica TaxID=2126181 RepID=A0A8H6S054_9AGAR|nr:uncharacterized protein MIND_01329000 [Mycena indigotica]KAF7290158.1 hypothetical protein MIND_01329000 [Mycena indigotica]
MEPLHDIDVHKLRQEAETIDKAIHALEAELLRLKARRKAIDGQLSTIVYPVHTLPAEVLCRIFLAAVLSVRPEEVNTLLLSITAVCQQWRGAAIADPHLWTQSCYYLPIPPPGDRLFGYFLQRAKGLPIVFSVDGRGAIYALFEFVFASCRHWSEAIFSCPNRFHFRLHFDSPGRQEMALDLPNLSKLTPSENSVSANGTD